MDMNSYYALAENDLLYLKESIRLGLLANSMAATAQNICERFFKHILDASGDEDVGVMRAHSLTKIMRRIEEKEIAIPEELKSMMLKVNGYYFSTRYPGDEFIEVTAEEIKEACSAAEKCKEFTDAVLKNMDRRNEKGRTLEDAIAEAKACASKEAPVPGENTTI